MSALPKCVLVFLLLGVASLSAAAQPLTPQGATLQGMLDSVISHGLQARGAEATARTQSDPKSRKEFYLRAAAEHRAAAAEQVRALQYATKIGAISDADLAHGYSTVAEMYRAAIDAEAKAAGKAK